MTANTNKKYTIVLKLGSSSLIDADTMDLKLSTMTRIVETVTELKRQGHRVVIVSSGGIAMGLKVMHLAKRPSSVSEIQAMAAIGQSKLIGRWDNLFQQYEQEIAQILLTRNDILDWKQFKNARNTINELLDMNITPIVNENDTLSISEIEFGDNDTLSGVTAALIQADFLFLLTDVECLFTNDPRIDIHAKPILTVENLHLGQGTSENPLSGVDLSNGSGTSVGTGGMKTKVVAADLATNSGVHTIILKSDLPENIGKILSYMEIFPTLNIKDDDNELLKLKELNVPLHTKFLAKDSDKRLESRQFWLLHGLVTKGSIIIDEKTYEHLNEYDSSNNNSDSEDKISLDCNKENQFEGLDVNGIIGVQDKFHEMECVNVKIGKTLDNGELDPDFPLRTVGRAMVNYTSSELQKIKGLTKSKEIQDILGVSELSTTDHNDISDGGAINAIRSNNSSLSVVASRENLALTPYL